VFEIHLTEKQHKELLALIVHYQTRTDRWAISPGLRQAIIETKDSEDGSK